MRLFVSIDLDGLADAVARVQDRLADASGLSFVDPDLAHITLKFIGEVEESRVPVVSTAVADAVAAADVEPFTATVGGLGVFPNEEYIRVVWLGLTTGAAPTTRLHEAIEDHLTDRGFEPESHEFTPHATIARMGHAGGKELVQRVVREAEPHVGDVEVSAVRLKRSRLTDDGPHYSTVEPFPLGHQGR